MSTEVLLNGQHYPEEFGTTGVRVVSPSVLGKIECVAGDASARLRAIAFEPPVSQAQLREAELENRHTLVADELLPAPGSDLSHWEEPGRDEGVVELQVDVPEGEFAIAIYEDPSGTLSLHSFRAAEGAALTRSRGVAQTTSLRVRPPAPDPSVTTRGAGARATVHVVQLVFGKLLRGKVGELTASAVAQWEAKHRGFQGFLEGAGGALFDALPQPFARWNELRGKRALLFMHGTTSTAGGAFAGLRDFPELYQRLQRHYEGRVLAFNHPTLSQSVATNVQHFRQWLPPGDYRFDIVCHSRGGLVARGLAELDEAALGELLGTPFHFPSDTTLQIDKIVFVATPNGGTPLAHPDTIGPALNRLANLAAKLPDSVGILSLSGVLALASSVTASGLETIPGLMDQCPDSPLLRKLNGASSARRQYYALQAHYQPIAALARVVSEGVISGLFARTDNDLVVPTRGVSRSGGFELPAERVAQYEDGVHHCNFFRAAERWQRVLGFLGVDHP